MDLNFSELDNIDTINKAGEPNNYWEQNSKPVVPPQKKKKKISFDDILSNMNLVVNKTGVLQSMALVNKQTEEPLQQQYSQQPQQYYQEYTEQPPNNVQVKKQEPLDPSLKHSYIFNKYFKDYQDATPQAPEVKIPKTREEYFRMIQEERLRRIHEAHRISQIKSRKLMFTANNTYQENIRTTANKLHKMSFH